MSQFITLDFDPKLCSKIKEFQAEFVTEIIEYPQIIGHTWNRADWILKIYPQTASGCDCRPCRRQLDSNQEIFDSIDFYLGRLTRILPVYYFCLIAGAIIIPFGHGPFAPDNLRFNVGGSVMSIFLVQTWVMWFGFGANGVSWTISTLFFFYFVYPR